MLTRGIAHDERHGRNRCNIYLVFEYMEHDLHGLMDRHVSLDVSHIKCIMQQILEGVKYVHSKSVMHRDIKGANVLLDNKGNVKLADFGLGIEFDLHKDRNFTNRVVTPWYRCPELLLGSERYTTAIDMWSVGCLFAELFTSRALFPGDREARVLELIYEKCGPISEENWPGVSSLRFFKAMAPKKKYQKRLRDEFKGNQRYCSSRNRA